MDEKYNAICLKRTAFRDDREMLTLFTLERGIVDCALIGAKKAGSKLRFCGETFCFAEYVLAEKSDRRTVKEANEIDCFYGIRSDLDRYYCAAVVDEFLLNVAYQGEENYQLFLLSVKTLKAVELGEKPRLALVWFLINALNAVGYLIDFSACHDCGGEIKDRAFFDFYDSRALCGSCSSERATEIKYDTYSLIKAVSEMDGESLKNVGISTYSKTFDNDKSILNAIRFFDHYIKMNLSLNLKTIKSVIGS